MQRDSSVLTTVANMLRISMVIEEMLHNMSNLCIHGHNTFPQCRLVVADLVLSCNGPRTVSGTLIWSGGLKQAMPDLVLGPFQAA